MSIPYFNAEDLRTAAPFHRAIAAIEEGLRGMVDPEKDSPRLFSPVSNGEFLIMPTEAERYSGVKVVTIAPMNPRHGLEKIQGIYVLFDASTSAPLAVMDGAELTAIRTPATTLTAVKHMVAAAPDGKDSGAPPHILVFGAGVQALNHIRAARVLFPEAVLSVVGRRPERVAELISALAAEGIEVTDSTSRCDDAVSRADIILCVTSSAYPLFGGDLPRADAVIAAVGQHGLSAREVDPQLVLRSDIVVEGRESAWRESGNLAHVRSETEWRALNPPNLKDLVAGSFTRTSGRPALYTGVGMAWEDLVTAAMVYETHRNHTRADTADVCGLSFH